MYSFLDEAGYMGMTYTLKKGTIYADQANLKFPQSFFNGEHVVFKHPFGWPLFLIPFTPLNGNLMFLGTLFYFVLGYIFFLKILKLFEAPDYYGFLYLFYPPFVIYSRTIMSDLPSGVFMLISFYFLLKEKRFHYFLAGFLTGISVSMRYPNIFFFLVFSISLFMKDRKGFTLYLLGALPWGIFIILYNYYSYHTFSGDLAHTGFFTRKVFLNYFFHYLLSLFLIYPFLPLAPHFSKKALRYETTAVLFIFVVFYSFWYFYQMRDNFVETLIMGPRFIIPVMFLLIPYYPFLCERIFSASIKNLRTFLKILFPFIFIIAGSGISLKHQKFTIRQKAVRDFIIENTPEGEDLVLLSHTSELLQSFWISAEIHYEFPEICKEKACYVATDNLLHLEEFGVSIEWIKNFDLVYLIKTRPLQ
jgi:hypothetical protein